MERYGRRFKDEPLRMHLLLDRGKNLMQPEYQHCKSCRDLTRRTPLYPFCLRACKARILLTAALSDTVVSYILATSALRAVREGPSR